MADIVERLRAAESGGYREEAYTKLCGDAADEVALLRNAVEGAASWQPIETAPRDGTAILLGFWYQGRFAQYQAFWGPLGWMVDSRQYHPKHFQEWFRVWHPLPAAPLAPHPSTDGA